MIPDDTIRFRQIVDPAKVMPEEAVEEGGLAGVDFPADDEQKRGDETFIGARGRQVFAQIGVGFRRQFGGATHHVRQSLTHREVALTEHGVAHRAGEMTQMFAGVTAAWAAGASDFIASTWETVTNLKPRRSRPSSVPGMASTVVA